MKHFITRCLTFALLAVTLTLSAYERNPFEQLLYAIVDEGNFDEATRLIESGIDINTIQDDVSPLVLSIVTHDEDAVKFCLTAGADVNQIVDGMTALELAEYVHGYGPPTNIIAILKKAKANPQAFAKTLQAEKTPSAKKTKTDPLGLGQATLDGLIDKEVPYSKWSRWGQPQTLPGTDSSRWVAYLPKANISFITNKKTDAITFATFGKGAEAQAKKVPDWIKKQFSTWDGSHHTLEKYIKAQMHNPDSYEHVKTVSRLDGDGLFVTTTFRGTNTFKAVITSSMAAKVDRNGNIIEANLQ